MNKYINLALILPLSMTGFSFFSGNSSANSLIDASGPYDGIALGSSSLIIGNSASVSLASGPILDRAERKRRERRNDNQIVYLNFETIGSPTFPVFSFVNDFDDELEVADNFPDYIFTAQERQEIQRRLETDFAGFDISFTQIEPARGDFTTIFFSDNDDFFAVVDQNNPKDFFFNSLVVDTDFLNKDRNDTVSIDITPYQYANLVNFSNANFTNFFGIEFEGSVDENLSMIIINEASNIAARELLSLMGGEFHDGFGAPGQGIPSTVSRDDFIPRYAGPQRATETNLHISVLSEFRNDSATKDLFLSERSALKLELGQRVFSGRFDVTKENRSSPDQVQEIRLRKIPIPNTILTGQNAGANLVGKVAVIEATLDELDEVDSYQFRGSAGDVITIEFSTGLEEDFLEDVVGNISLNLVNRDGSLTEVTSNNTALEDQTPLILDFTLPSKGNYVVKLDAPDVFFDFDFNPDTFEFELLPFSFEEEGLNDLRLGDYSLILYMIEAKK